jgi:hypothetical protein
MKGFPMRCVDEKRQVNGFEITTAVSEMKDQRFCLPPDAMHLVTQYSPEKKVADV